MMECERGKCLVCGTEIARTCAACNNAWQNLGNYTTVELTWSNGSRMTTAMCIDCATGHKWTTQDIKKQMTEAIQKAWDKTGGRYDKAVVLV